MRWYTGRARGSKRVRIVQLRNGAHFRQTSVQKPWAMAWVNTAHPQKFIVVGGSRRELCARVEHRHKMLPKRVNTSRSLTGFDHDKGVRAGVDGVPLLMNNHMSCTPGG